MKSKATSDGSVYIATNNKVYRFDARSARLIHSYDIEWQGVPNKVSSFFEDPQTHNLWITLQKADYAGSTRQQQRFVPFFIGRSILLPPHWYGTRTTISFGSLHTATGSSSSALMPGTATAFISPYGKEALGSPSAKIIYNLLQDPTSGDLWAGSGDGVPLQDLS